MAWGSRLRSQLPTMSTIDADGEYWSLRGIESESDVSITATYHHTRLDELAILTITHTFVSVVDGAH